MKFKPLNDRVLVKRLEAEEKIGGIFIPDSAQEKPMQGLIVAVGEGKYTENGALRPLEVKEGQIVFFRKYAGSEVTVDGIEHMILREDEILAILQ
ncbi:MAG: co-chaperone GroES [Myxococcaceae bacterium]|nr:co-chaperone GroES [Myxococcaceae bacterium]MBH2006050.1 co-chaperone GroES [Myxococcaceae bacterium]